LQTEIAAASDKIAAINKERLVLEQQAKKIEAEVGPIKYVAALIYGDNNADVDTLEKAVRWMIIILVIVFDPLAVVLILAATSGLQYTSIRKDPLPAPVYVETPVAPLQEEPKKNLTEIQIQETLLPESSLEPLEFPKKLSATKRAPRKSKSQ